MKRRAAAPKETRTTTAGPLPTSAQPLSMHENLQVPHRGGMCNSKQQQQQTGVETESHNIVVNNYIYNIYIFYGFHRFIK